MSRYTIKHPTLEIAVGWDNPLCTLFALHYYDWRANDEAANQ